MRTLCCIFLEGDASVKDGMSVWNSFLVLMLGRKIKSTNRRIFRVKNFKTPGSFSEPLATSLVSGGQKSSFACLGFLGDVLNLNTYGKNKTKKLQN